MKNKPGLSRVVFLFLVFGIFVLMAVLMPGIRSTLAQNGPTVAKDSVRVKATRIDGVWKNGRKEDGSSWLPAIEYRVNGLIPSGSQFTVDFSLPADPKWLK